MSKPDNYKNINDSFETGFENNSNKELVHRFKRIDNEYGRQDILVEMNRRLIDEIVDFNNSSSKQTNVMIKLTWFIAFLTIAILILGAIQIIFYLIK